MRLRLVVLLACLALLVPVGFVLVRGEQDPPEKAVLTSAATRHSIKQFTTTADFTQGRSFGVTTDGHTLRIGRIYDRPQIDGVPHERAFWRSPVVRPGFGFSEVIPSWRAVAPRDTWVVVRIRVRATDGRYSGWKRLAQWRQSVGRTTFGSQADRIASVSTDTLKARTGVTLDGYQFRVELLRRAGTTAVPMVGSVHAVASRIGAVPATSKQLFPGRTLTVPRYSQMIHRGEYPEYGGGGQAWCSPTSLSMILAYYGKAPTSREYAWVNSRYPDRWVAHTAREVYDSGYDGAGNWAFNTAYAGTRLPTAIVGRLASLRDVERFIAARIPVEVSISFGRGQLTGAPISATAGHLVVIRGFTRTGNVVVNDPAAASNDRVNRIYDRAQFERAWLGKSHGLAYLIAGSGVALPSGYVS